MATINDVCRAAGVSKATVSRVINGTGQVRQSTREKVEAVMKQLNYRPSSLAQALANQTGNSIGLVVSDFTGSYFGVLLQQASVSAELMGKQLIFADGNNNAEDELKAVHSLAEKKCDIIVLYSRMLSCEQIVELNKSVAIPIVNVGRALPKEAGFSIAFHQTDAMTKAGSHLVKLGHKQLTYIGPEPTTPTASLRLQGFLQLVDKNADLGVQGKVCVSAYGFTQGYEATKAYLEKGESFGTGIVSAADDIAIGCIKALQESGIRVPEDISVVSVDNDPCSPFVNPPLTTVDVPIKSITERAMEVAKQLIENKKAPEPEICTGKLIVRNSAISL